MKEKRSPKGRGQVVGERPLPDAFVQRVPRHLVSSPLVQDRPFAPAKKGEPTTPKAHSLSVEKHRRFPLFVPIGDGLRLVRPGKPISRSAELQFRLATGHRRHHGAIPFPTFGWSLQLRLQ
jgi:hypothetical protein